MALAPHPTKPVFIRSSYINVPTTDDTFSVGFQGLHSASMPGILTLDVCQKDTAKIVTGGNDKNAVVFNKDTEQVIAILQGHTKKVTGVIYHPEEVSRALHCLLVNYF